MTALRPQFEEAGARLAVVAATDTGAQDFIDNVWPNGEVYIDDEEEFKKAENDSAAEANTENINAKNPNVEKLRNPGHSDHSSYSFI